MKKILIIQSRARPEIVAAEQGEYRRAICDSADISFESSLNVERAWFDPGSVVDGFDAVIFGGSGEFDLHSNDDARLTPARDILTRITAFITYLVENDIPTLGVCFGHQLIGEIYGGAVSSDPGQKKVGTHEVHLTNDGKADPLFSRMPASFNAQYGHRNALTKLPAGAALLAKSDMCKFSALRFQTNIYTTQFHPELTPGDVVGKFAMTPGYLPEGFSAASLIKESPEASQLIPLFLELILLSGRVFDNQKIAL